ncbi:MAG: hypothetical protein HY854_10275 [Burkholderiales bacterium]|nr:hypothetical protein [Burkholderiales bacterium]
MGYFSNLSRIATTVAVVASAALSGCAINMKVPVKDPAPSMARFKQPAGAAAVGLAFKDERSAENKANVVSGLIPMHVVYEDKPFDPVPWLARHTVKEPAARGLPVTLGDGRGVTTTVQVSNPRAIPELVKLSTHANEYVRLAALSSLGILKATDQFDFLARAYENTGLMWQDRAMALKAIGDFGTPQSREYLLKQRAQLESRKDKDATWTKEIIALYL